MSFDVIFMFDVIILVLGFYLLILSLKAIKDKTVATIVVPAVDMVSCTDVPAMSHYLMPKVVIFAVICLICGVQGVLNDTKLLEMPMIVNNGFLVGFLATWCWFSYIVVQARKRYLHQ